MGTISAKHPRRPACGLASSPASLDIASVSYRVTHYVSEDLLLTHIVYLRVVGQIFTQMASVIRNPSQPFKTRILRIVDSSSMALMAVLTVLCRPRWQIGTSFVLVLPRAPVWQYSLCPPASPLLLTHHLGRVGVRPFGGCHYGFS